MRTSITKPATTLLLFFIFSLSPIFSQSYQLQKLSGDNQQQIAGTSLKEDIRVKVISVDGLPAENIEVTFSFLISPSDNARLQPEEKKVRTDSLGIARIKIKLGKETGEYTLMVRLNETLSDDYLIFRFTALKKNWVFLLVTGLLGGLGLFLLGMNMMSQGLQKSAGKGLRNVLSNLTRNRFFALLVGTLVTMVIQSSSATSVMLVSFVNSGLMAFSQSLGVILGASLGTTITAQLIAFHLTDYALFIIAIGFAMYTFLKNEKLKQTGEAILGFGILFFGMHIMSETMVPLRTFNPFLDFIVRLENPFLGILTGAVLTALIQSSSAFIGIMIVLAGQGLLSLEASIPLVFGANIGTAITAILASLNTRREAKKVALAHTLFKILGVLIFVWFIPELARVVSLLSPAGTDPDRMNLVAENLPRQVANIHTIFNVLVVILILPFTKTMARFISWLVPDKKTPEDELLQTKYLQKARGLPPSVALKLANQEVVHMAHVVQDMVNNLLPGFILKEKSLVQWMEEKERQVDYLRDQLNDFLQKITAEKMEKNRTTEAFELMYTIKEFEQIADIVHTLYKEKAPEWFQVKTDFSAEGKKELNDYHLQVIKQISRAIDVFKKHNLEKARLMKTKHRKYRYIAMKLEKKHFSRIADRVEETLKTSQIHQELMTALATIYSHATNVARIFLEWEEER
ncbi:MAG: Na/Pi symporter [Bacteroidales bacterium]